MTLNEKIKIARIEKKMTQKDLALELTSRGYKITHATISNWELSNSQPDADTIFELCKILDKDANYFFGWEENESEIVRENENKNILALYNSLLPQYKNESVSYMKYLKGKQDDLMEPSEELFAFSKSKVKILGQTAAGKPLDYGDTIADDINSLSGIPANADFALTVKGDSMEPLIKDGSIVYIHSQNDAESGEICIVEIDGAVTCKKVYRENGNLKLVSLNSKYEPMLINKGNARILGKVILKNKEELK